MDISFDVFNVKKKVDGGIFGESRLFILQFFCDFQEQQSLKFNFILLKKRGTA
jgi:hypothetical protein